MNDPGEKQLVDLARTGDQDAFTELFRQSRPQIEAVGRNIFRGPGSEADLEDFCSDVWMLGFRYIASFRGECQFSTWVVQVAKHKALAILQRQAQLKNGDGRLVYRGSETTDEQWESQCSGAEDRRMEATIANTDVGRLIEALSPGHRELIQLHHLDGFTETEIARRKGLSIVVVRGRLSRAMVQLRKKVEKGAYRNGTEFSLTK
jgi:RNA polymerase sigma-70 factor (ECF subfamily)